MKETRLLLIDFIKKILAGLPEEIKGRFQGAVEMFPASRKEFGDYSTNLAFKLAGKGLSPHQIAGTVAAAMNKELPAFLDRVEEKGGYLNFFLKKDVHHNVLKEILTKGAQFGSSQAGHGRKVLVEFVSANPTGPLTIAHGRQAAFGESLSRILSFTGFAVTREYYLNDSGRQIQLLGESLKARYSQLQGKGCSLPDEGYQGDYLVDIARTIRTEPDSEDFFRKYAVQEILNGIKEDLTRFGVSFDHWVNENDFLAEGKVERLLESLKAKQLVYFQDNSWWFKSSAFGDDKDRVVVKTDGSYTYLAPDMAYHQNKIERGYDLLINLWGPDHCGYVPRLKAAVQILGFPPENLKIIIVQLTTLYRGQEKLRMSTRAGEFITLRQLMEEVGPDAAKFFFLFRRAESHLDFDLEIAKKQSLENPVYYLQYAYVRIRHVLGYAGEQGMSGLPEPDLALLKTEEETGLMKTLGGFPEVVDHISRSLGVHLLAEYLLDLAKQFHAYYQHHRIVSQDQKLTAARLFLIKALYVVFSNALNLLNISLPEQM